LKKESDICTQKKNLRIRYLIPLFYEIILDVACESSILRDQRTLLNKMNLQKLYYIVWCSNI